MLKRAHARTISMHRTFELGSLDRTHPQSTGKHKSAKVAEARKFLPAQITKCGRCLGFHVAAAHHSMSGFLLAGSMFWNTSQMTSAISRTSSSCAQIGTRHFRCAASASFVSSRCGRACKQLCFESNSGLFTCRLEHIHLECRR